MIKSREHQELESSCRLTFHVCKAVFEDQNSYAVVYGIKGVDEVGNLRVHIREVLFPGPPDGPDRPVPGGRGKGGEQGRRPCVTGCVFAAKRQGGIWKGAAT